MRHHLTRSWRPITAIRNGDSDGNPHTVGGSAKHDHGSADGHGDGEVESPEAPGEEDPW